MAEQRFKWARFCRTGYECSTAGDRRFSALCARLRDGRTIEEAYQLDVKGYRRFSDRWQVGKGKRPLVDVDLWAEYLLLWERWADENPGLLEDLRVKAVDKILTDRFASTDISQARALAIILNQKYG